MFTEPTWVRIYDSPTLTITVAKSAGELVRDGDESGELVNDSPTQREADCGQTRKDAA